MRWRWVIIVLVIAVVAAGAYYGVRMLWPGQTAQASYDTVAAKRGNLVVSVAAAGSISARTQVSLMFGTGGRITEVAVKPGDVVKAGQTLMRIDTTDLEVEVARAKLSLATAQYQLKKLQAGSTEADVAAAKSAVKSAEESLARVKAGPTQAELAAAEAAVTSAQEAYQKLVDGPTAQDIQAAELHVSQAKNSLWGAQGSRDSVKASPQSSTGARASAEANVLNAELAVQLAELDLAKLKTPATAAQLQDAKAKVAQAKDSLKKLRESPTPADVAAAESALAQAQAKLDETMRGSSQEDLAVSQTQVEQAQLALQQAEKHLEDAALHAPFDGVILTVPGGVGMLAATTTTVATLADLSSLEINTPLSELDVVRAEKGQQVQIQVDALPEVRLRGHVERIAPAAVIEQGVANYLVTVVVDEANPKVRAGMSANVSIVVDQRQDVLLIPNRAVRSRGRDRVVAIVKNGGLEWVPIEVDASNDTMTEVKSGLQEGQGIVANPPNPSGGQQGGQGRPGDVFMMPGGPGR